MKKINTLRATVVAAVLATGSAAWATDGYFPHGYGMQSLGMGGASVAVTGNAFAGANNPALAAFAGNRYELGANLFMPKRGATRTGGSGMTAGMNGGVESGSSTFIVPEFGYNRQIGSDMAVGLSVYGNGGMNTDYGATGFDCTGAGPRNNMLCGNTKLGVNLMQLIVAPTFAYKLSETSAIGVSPLLVYQQFKASGLQAFAGNPQWTGQNTYATNTTDNGNDSSKGWGVRLGYTTAVNDAVRLGVSYSPKINMGRFKKYSQLFAEGGDFDIPENYAMGVTIQASPAVLLALDYQRINYSDVKAIGNQMMQGGPLGADNGPGFGWSDLNVFKLGVEWKQSQNLTLRAGYNHTNNPISGANVTFNIIAPGVITDHYTLGATYKLDDKSDLTFAYMYAPKNTVTGTSALSGTPETIRMSQQSLGIQYGWKF
ncbi:OmpP1/FadL family transporter [Limnohabitans sp. T6-20]|uniref:OmpP1/FadL family transporter n=1 Tax=Limnohabitans sp. T6-20 TaxID=1100725 RepID=UPI000D37C943|nr:outer membrane protein transport protein [Limnohabitans sp. T6-20]PUE12038.1 long-chain fatty acid transporter [Limnohabitans sp. T6-20]